MSHPKKKVLVVDDSDSVREIAADVIQSEHLDWQVQTARNGAVALEMIQAALLSGTPFDLVISDVQMPLLSGPDLYVAVERLSRPMPRWVFMTGGCSAAELNFCRAKAQAVLPKPFDVDDLLGVIG